MKRGVIISVESDYYIVVANDGEVVSVRRALDPELETGDEMFWSDQWELSSGTTNLSGTVRDWTLPLKRFSALAASILLVLFFWNWMSGGPDPDKMLENLAGKQAQKQTSALPGSNAVDGEFAIKVNQLPTDPRVVAYMTIDINPSIELGLDENDRVIFARAVNKDGEQVLAGMDVQGKAADETAD